MKQYIANKSPIYYGWIILLISTSMSAVRPVMAVATLSVFITPMSDELNWSRTAFSGAVSIGGFVGAFASPIIGKESTDMEHLLLWHLVLLLLLFLL